MQELDLRSILYLLLTRIKWIILGFVAGALLLGGYSALLLPEQYTSSAMLYVYNMSNKGESQTATTGNLTAAEQLTKTIRAATTADWALNRASEELGDRLSAKELGQITSFSSVEETAFLSISVTYTDALLAQQACDVMAQTAVDAFAATGETGSAKVYQPAVTAQKTSPNVAKHAVLGAFVGVVIAVAVILLNFMMNTTVRDKVDLQRRLNVPVLGEIPSFDLATKGGRKHG